MNHLSTEQQARLAQNHQSGGHVDAFDFFFEERIEKLIFVGFPGGFSRQ